VILVSLLFAITYAAIPLTKNQKTFGHSIKNGWLPKGVEYTTFEYNCTMAPCVIN